MLLNCPECKKKVSQRTIISFSVCSDCQNKSIINRYLTDYSFTLLKVGNEYKAKLLLEFIDFINSSHWKNIKRYRMIVDFIKILKFKDDKSKYKETEIESYYYSNSSIKSATTFYEIKVFLYAKNLLILDKQYTDDLCYPEDIRPEKRIKKNVIEYFYDINNCKDCGKVLTSNSTHKYCYDCVAFRAISNKTSYSFIDETFNNDLIKELYIRFIQYSYEFNRKIQSYLEIIENAVCFFIFLQKYIPEEIRESSTHLKSKKKNNNIKLVYNNYLKFSLTQEWFLEFEKENLFKKTYKKVYLTFLEKEGLIKLNNIDEKSNVVKQLLNVDKKFAEPLLKMIELEERKIENLQNKNALKSKKWITVNKTINEIISFYKWLNENYNLSSWAEVTEDMVNKYLLILKFKNMQIVKRTLFNFFTYLKKHKFIFSVPIEQFVARDNMIDVNEITFNHHKEIFNIIEFGKESLVLERLFVTLIYFHGLTSNQIINIKLDDIKLNEKLIVINNRPPAFLSNGDMVLLSNYLKIRNQLLNRKKSISLFPSFKSLTDSSISTKFIYTKVKNLTGLSPQLLRIAAFQYCASKFGAHYLNECFGLSITQSARYGRIGEELLGEFVEDEIKRN